jgi:hypothetical protein
VNQARRDLLVARVVSGTVRCHVTHHSHHAFLLKKPSRESRYIAEEIYQDVFDESELEGLFSEEELYKYLLETNLWDEEKETLLNSVIKDIDNFKVGLFQMVFQSNQRTTIRKAIDKARQTQKKLVDERNIYNYLSCNGAAAMAKNRYLTGASLCYIDGRPVFTDATFWEDPSDLLESVLIYLGQNRIEETQYRELSRTEPWRSLWSCRKAEGTFFGIPPIDYTDEQRAMVCWSSLYDNVHEHPDCPDDTVLEDDDMLDGWLIMQRRKREDSLLKKSGEEAIGNENVRNSQQVFLPAQTLEDAKKIHALNTPFAAAMKKHRQDLLNKEGKVNEIDMPDTKKRLQMEATAKFSEAMRKK